MREGIYFAGNAIVEKRGVWYSGEYKRTIAYFIMMIYWWRSDWRKGERK